MQTVINSPDGGAGRPDPGRTRQCRARPRTAANRVSRARHRPPPNASGGHLFKPHLNPSQKNEQPAASDAVIARCGGNTAPTSAPSSTTWASTMRPRDPSPRPLDRSPPTTAVIAFQNFIDRTPSTTGTPATLLSRALRPNRTRNARSGDIDGNQSVRPCSGNGRTDCFSLAPDCRGRTAPRYTWVSSGSGVQPPADRPFERRAVGTGESKTPDREPRKNGSPTSARATARYSVMPPGE